MRKQLFYLFFALLAGVILFAGCKVDKKLNITLDTSKKQSATVTDSKGAGFEIEYGGTTATVIVMPGVFPAGTDVSVTPLSNENGLEGEKLSTFFEIKAISGGKAIQPSMPVFFTLAFEGDLPESACLVAYDDGESAGYKVESQIFYEDGISYVSAELNHFTIVGVGKDGNTVFATAPPEIKEEGEWKEWRLMVNGPPESLSIEDNEIWDFEASLQMTAVNTSSNIGGVYTGDAVITITGKAKEGIVPSEANMEFLGDISLKLNGETEFLIRHDPSEDSDTNTELLPGDPRVDVGQWLCGRGNMEMLGSASADFGLEGPDVLPDAGYEGQSQAGDFYDCFVIVCENGAFFQITGIGIWKGIMVGVPKGGLSEPGYDENETLASSGTDVSEGMEILQGEIFDLTREGWPADDISGSIPEYTMGEVVNSGGSDGEYTILVGSTGEEDLNEYLQTLADNGWYTESDYAEKDNLSLYFQFNSKSLLQISIYSRELGTWPYDEIPSEIVPPDVGTLIGEVEITQSDGSYNAYYISFEYGGLSEDDVREYMDAYMERGWSGDEYYIKNTISWKGRDYKVNIEPMPDGDNYFFICNMIEAE